VSDRLLPRWLPGLFLTLTAVLIPWTVWLYVDLPGRAQANHWAGVWAGFDVGLAVALGLTGLNIWRRSPWALVTASAAGTMLLVDAWFDTLTAARGWPLAVALVMAFGAEIPLAILCFWVALNMERVFARAQRGAAGAGAVEATDAEEKAKAPLRTEEGPRPTRWNPPDEAPSARRPAPPARRARPGPG
jgi:hypothetical protein